MRTQQAVKVLPLIPVVKLGLEWFWRRQSWLCFRFCLAHSLSSTFHNLSETNHILQQSFQRIILFKELL